MKKAICIFTIFCMLMLSACSAKEVKPNSAGEEDATQDVSGLNNTGGENQPNNAEQLPQTGVDGEGFKQITSKWCNYTFADGTLLEFENNGENTILSTYNYEDGKLSKFCGLPDCSHESAPCNAYMEGFSASGIAAWQNNVYVFGINNKNEDYKSKIMKIDMNNNTQEDICEIDQGHIVSNFVAADNSNLYFLKEFLDFSETGEISLYEMSLCALNLDNHTLGKVADIGEYDVIGTHADNFVLSKTEMGVEEKFVGDDYFPGTFLREIKFLNFDGTKSDVVLNTEECSACTSIIEDGIYYYVDPEGVITGCNISNGEETKYINVHGNSKEHATKMYLADNIFIADGYYYDNEKDLYNRFAFNIDTGEEVSLTITAKGEGAYDRPVEIMSEHNGGLVVANEVNLEKRVFEYENMGEIVKDEFMQQVKNYAWITKEDFFANNEVYK